MSARASLWYHADMLDRAIHVLRRGAGFLAAYLVTAWLVGGNDFFRHAPLWLPTGVAVAGLWRLGLRWWPIVAIATIVHRIALDYSFPKYLFGATGNVLEAVTAVAILNRLGFRPDFRRLRDVLALMAAAAVAPVASALAGRSVRVFWPESFPFLEGVIAWWRMNALGIMVVVPAVLTWSNVPILRPGRRTVLEITTLAAMVAGIVALLVYVQHVREPAGTAIAYLALPVTLGAALRFGVRGAATTTAIVATLLVAGAQHGIGPFVDTPPFFTPAAVRVLSLQLAIAVLCVTPLLLGAAIAEREAAQAALAAERERYEDRLRHGQKMEALGMLAGGVAHDFNNLLTVIGGFADLLRADLPEGVPQRAAADEIARAAERASGLTRQLLAYSRRQKLEFELTDLRDVVGRLGTMLVRLLGQNVRLSLPEPGPPARVRVDRGQIEQVVMNLAINARDAMPDGGALVLTVDALDLDEATAAAHEGLAPGAHVVLRVRDEGTGMPDDVRRRAFDPFYTTKPPGRGTGLGLSTVWGIVRQSGGAVWIESAPGRGTIVHVCLPAARETDAAPALAHPAPGTSVAGRTILVVEDEPRVRDLVCRALRGEGHWVLEAADGLEGLAAAAKVSGPIHLAVTDVVMPRMGGREFARRFGREHPGVPVLFISGYDSEAPGEPADATPAHQWLAKPFTSSDLVRHAHELMLETGKTVASRGA